MSARPDIDDIEARYLVAMHHRGLLYRTVFLSKAWDDIPELIEWIRNLEAQLQQPHSVPLDGMPEGTLRLPKEYR